MTTAKNTKAQLAEELETAKKDLAKLEQQMKDFDKYKIYDDGAKDLKAIYDAYVNVGFTEEQAFELMGLMLKMISNNTTTFNISGTPMGRVLK